MDGFLWFRGHEGLRFVVPSEDLREKVFDLAHGAAMAGHRSETTTEHRIRMVAWWPTMTTWVRRRCRACFACARAKHRTNQAPPPLRTVELPHQPFDHVHIDALEGLPEVDGMDNVWVVLDRFSHWVFLVPASSRDNARALARRLFAAVFAYVGLPRRIGSDRDPILSSNFTQSLFNLAGVTSVLTAPHHRIGNGFAERPMRTLREYLRATTNANRMDWLELLPSAQFAFNTSWVSAVGATPAQVVLGFRPRGPIDLALPTVMEDPSDAADFLRMRRTFQFRAVDQFTTAQVDMLHRSNLRSADKGITIGDQVFVRAEVLPDPGEAHLPAKLRSAFTGPYTVRSVSDANVTISLPTAYGRDKTVVSRRNLFVFEGLAPEAEAEPEANSSSGEAEACRTEPSYAVEAVVRHRRRRGREPEYLVCWVGDHRRTWEPASNFDHVAPIQNYWHNWKQRHPRGQVPDWALQGGMEQDETMTDSDVTATDANAQL